ncbi:MAG: hypothetical protein ACXWW0_01515 [Bacteroidia bacterium]
MKTIYTLGFVLISSLFTQSCTTSQSSLRELNDDVYYTPADDKFAKAPVENNASDKKYGSETNPDAEGNYKKDSYRNQGNGSGDTYINNNTNYYYDNDYEYSNFPYSSRMNRFYRPSMTFGYYDPFYTPYRYNSGLGLSLYFGTGYNYYDPFYNPYYDPFFSPYSYGYYNPYNYYYDPYAAYNRGYWHGYYDNNYYKGGSNWSGGGSGSGGSGRNTYYGPRGQQGGHNILNSGANSLPDRFKKETPVKDNKPGIGNTPTINQPKQENNNLSKPRFDSQPKYDAPKNDNNKTYERAP